MAKIDPRELELLAGEADKRLRPWLYYRPNRGQRPFHEDSRRFRILFAGNRFGKSYAGANEADLAAMHQHPIIKYRRGTPANPFKIRVMSKPDALAEELQPTLLRLLPPDMRIKSRAGPQGFDKRWECHKSDWSALFSFKSNNQDPEEMESTPQDLVWIDEGCSYRQYWAHRTRLGAGEDYSLRMFFTLTPHELVNWMEGEFYDTGPGDTLLSYDNVGIHYGSVWDNAISNGGYLLDDEVKALVEAARKDPVLYEAIINGKPVSFSRRVLPMFDERIHTFDRFNRGGWDKEKGMPKWGNVYVTIDPHAARPFFIQFWLVTPGGRGWLIDEYPNYFEGEFAGQRFEYITTRAMTPDAIAAEIGARAKAIGLPVNAIGIDPHYSENRYNPEEARVNSIVEILNVSMSRKAMGLPRIAEVDPHRDDKGEIHAGIALLRQKLWSDDKNPPELMFDVRCRNTINALRGARYERKSEKEGAQPLREKMEELLKHAIDDIRYFIALEPTCYPPPLQPQPARNLGWAA